jgi:diguanylate cyclase (GGDEF)-like protein/PAS domain S-box-containing protein
MSKKNGEILSLLESLKHQTNELLANQLLYAEMVDNNTDGLLVVNCEGIILFANKMAAEMFNRKKSRKLEGEVFGFAPVENEVTEISVATDNKVRSVEMHSRRIEWDGRQAMLVVLRATADRGAIRLSLQKASESLKILINASPLAIIVVEMAGGITLWNRMSEEIFGWSEIEMRGQPFPFIDTPLDDYFERALSGESFFKQEVSGQFGLYGLAKIFNLWATPLKNAVGATIGVMLMIADVTENKLHKQKMEHELLKSEKRFRMALSNSPVSVSSQDIWLRYTWAYNPMAGLQEARMIGKTDAELFLPEDAAQLIELKTRVLTQGIESRAELKIQRDGRLYFYDISAEPTVDASGNISGVTCAATDVSALRHTESLASFALHHDTLTGLPNRSLFCDRLQQALVLAQREGVQHFAVMHFGIDQFKTINQCFGHAIGDQLLLDVGQRMTGVMYEIDTVSRVGGDEFLILVHNIQDSQDASLIVRKIMASLQQPFTVSEQEVFITASIGVAVYPNDGATADDLLRNADAAMHRAKEDLGRGNYQFFCEDMNSRAMHQFTLEADLRRALDQGEFHLHYQPQIEVKSISIIGAEALIRWNHPEKGNIPPGVFIPAAESSGLIEPIGDWVLQAACSQHRQWLDAGFPPIRIAVNLSARQFLRGDLSEKVAQALAASGMQPEYLELELTESMLMQDVDSTVSTLNELKRMGVRLSIDDFGTGYSSLSYLKRFPLDLLKIDKSFVADLDSEVDDGEIARAIIAMAHALRLEVVAEGVETQRQLDFIRDSQCDFIQGYFFSKPLPPEEFTKLKLQ